MSIRLYMDVHVRWAVTDGLRRRGIDVLTAQEDDSAELDDPALLDRSTVLGRVPSLASSMLTSYGSPSARQSAISN